MTGTIRVKPLAISIAIPLAVGFLSSLLAGDMKQVYAALNLPSFAPPGIIFGIVWPVLYVMMGIASYIIWETEDSSCRTQALTFYAVQLVLNFLWSPLFFRFMLFQLAFWELCALFVIALVTTACFALLNRKTLWLMLPYLVWLLYAAILNKAVSVLN